MNGESRPEGRPTGVGTQRYGIAGQVIDGCTTELADAALAFGHAVACRRCACLVAPDVVVLELIAAGEPFEPVAVFGRHDGRAVAVFVLDEADR